jgi:hypothetical protein
MACLHVSINDEDSQILEEQLAQIRPIVDDARTLVPALLNAQEILARVSRESFEARGALLMIGSSSFYEGYVLAAA